MTESLSLSLSLLFSWISGSILGLLYFAGLWLTVQKVVSSSHPALWIMGSLLFRTALVLLGFYYVSGGNLYRLILCLVSFITSRFVVLRITREREGSRYAH